MEGLVLLENSLDYQDKVEESSGTRDALRVNNRIYESFFSSYLANLTSKRKADERMFLRIITLSAKKLYGKLNSSEEKA